MAAKTSESTLKYMVDGIRYVCENFKKRAPGTESERNAQAFIRDELSKYSDEVEMEDFDLHPKAFMGFIPIAGFMIIVSVILFWFHNPVCSIIALILDIVSILMFSTQFLTYRSVFDFLFPKSVSRNVMARRKPTGEVKRRIIFCGHADAAHEWTYSYHGGMPALLTVGVGAVVSMFVVTIVNVLSVAGFFASHASWVMPINIIMGITIPFCIGIIFFINWRIIVDGANDNLTACYVAMAVLKEMDEADLRFENTEVCCLISGSEEAGLRGAKAYARRHKDELLETESVVVAMDTLREIEQMQVYTKGCTGTVRDSEAVGDLIHEAGVNVGIDMPRAELYPGAIDAEGFSMYGLTAAGFCGVNHEARRYYHTREDTADNISPECIALSLDVCREAARLYDEKGGIAYYENKRKKK